MTKMRVTFKRNVRHKEMKESANSVLKGTCEEIRAIGGQTCRLESDIYHITKKWKACDAWTGLIWLRIGGSDGSL